MSDNAHPAPPEEAAPRFVALFLSESKAQVPPHKGPKGNHAKEVPDESGAKPPDLIPLVAEVVPPPPRKKERRECRPDQTPWWKTAMDIAVVIFGGCAVFIYYQQLEATQDSLEVDQRAWVGPKTFAIANLPLEANKPIQIGLDYWNFGKTPALNVSGFAQPSLVVSTSNLDFAKWGEPLEGERGALFPGASNHIVREFEAIPEPVFSEFMHEKSFLYIYGNLGYDDIFGFHHWTHFCLRYSVPSSGFAYCDTFNDVDKESR